MHINKFDQFHEIYLVHDTRNIHKRINVKLNMRNVKILIFSHQCNLIDRVLLLRFI